MTLKALSKMTNDELKKLYVDIGIAQSDALDSFDTPRFNRLFEKGIAAVNELRSRAGDQRRLLTSLFTHANAQVRLNAARATYALDQRRAHSVLEKLASSHFQPQAGDAGMSLSRIASGESPLLSDPWISTSREERLGLRGAGGE